MTDCTVQSVSLQPLGRRKVEVDFNGGILTSDAGLVLVREVEEQVGVVSRIASCFTDYRDPTRTEHTVQELLMQRIVGIAAGYEDLNDHDELGKDPLLAAVVGKTDPLGEHRKRARDVGRPLASSATLGRLELVSLTPDEDRYKRISCDFGAFQRVFTECFVAAQKGVPEEVVLDFDATDSPLHGTQEERFFHGYYGNYCYLPLYVFCGKHLLQALLRPADIDASADTVEVLEELVGRLRQEWPGVRVVLRGDSGFCRDEILSWCEENDVDYVVGFAKNSRLEGIVAGSMAEARKEFEQTAEPVRRFEEFPYRTLDSWSRSRRVIAKVEHLKEGPNPRFVVTSLAVDARHLYEDIYCARGELENRIKEQQLYLFADRMSSHEFLTNQLRLWFSSAAYVLLHAIRERALAGTRLENAQCDTIRLKLLKIGAIVKLSVRRLLIRLPTAYPYKDVFMTAVHRLQSVRLLN